MNAKRDYTYAIPLVLLVRISLPTRRWVYLQLNLQVQANVPKAEEILRRAAKAGYNGVVLADYKLNILDRVPEHYFDHARQFKRIADELGLEVIPTVAPFGYSDGLLAHDPNLAEGIPVKDAPFVVKGGGDVMRAGPRGWQAPASRLRARGGGACGPRRAACARPSGRR